MLSVLVTSFNEVEFIEDCLESVDWADEVYLLDSFSTDGTAELVAEKFPDVRFEQRKYYGAAAQKNYGIDRCKNGWVLVVDSDERVTSELKQEILDLLGRGPNRWAYHVFRQNIVMGKVVSHGNFKRDRVIRFFHKKHARYPNLRVHADMKVDGPVGTLKCKLTHFYVRSFQHMSARMHRYAYWAASQRFVDGKRCGMRKVLFNPLVRFLRDYFLFLGILDGKIGFCLAAMEGYYVYQKYLYLWEFGQFERKGLKPELPEFLSNPEIWECPWEEENRTEINEVKLKNLPG